MDNQLKLLEALGRVERAIPSDVEPILANLDNQDLDEFMALVLFHKVAPQVSVNLQALTLSDSTASERTRELIDRLFQLIQYHPAIARGRDKELARLFERAKHIPFVILKGMYLGKRYKATHGERLTSDIDLYVATEWIWELLSAIVSMGYAVEKIRLDTYRLHQTDVSHRDGYGVVPTMKSSDTLPDYRTDFRHSIDIHFGAFPGCGGGYVDIHEGEALQSQAYLEPSPEDAISVLLAHTVRAGFCRLRDINDLYILLSESIIRFDVLEQRIADAHLEGVFRAILYVTNRVYPDFSQMLPEEFARRWQSHNALLMFDKRQEVEGRPPKVTPIPSRLLQCQYLWRWEKSRGGIIKATLDTVHFAIMLGRTNRPYPVWHSREIHKFYFDDHIILCPLSHFARPISWMDLLDRAARADIVVDWIHSLQIGILNRGQESELILTPAGVFTQCSYTGSRDTIPPLWADVTSLLEKLYIDDYEQATAHAVNWM